MYNNVLFRYSIGSQNTVSLTKHAEQSYHDLIWLSKLSISSFQKWFPDSVFLLLYNGFDFDSFTKLFYSISPKLLKDITVIDQRHPHIFGDKFSNPYHFLPVDGGVWYKWIPFRFDQNKIEISVDTDIICINEPKTWYKWLDNENHVLIAPERYEIVLPNTCGDFSNHPLLKGKKPYNCGVVGQKSDIDYSQEFYNICNQVDYGSTHNSLFITEQGAINLWVRLLEIQNVKHEVLDFEKNSWMRDFIYFINNGINVETIHCVAWYKKIASALKKQFEKKVFEDNYSNNDFVADILVESDLFDEYAKHVLWRQFHADKMSSEFLVN